VGSLEQIKTGNLIIEGVLRLGQFTTANAPSGTEGALYFDTTENKTKVYSSATWGDLGGGWDGIIPNYTTAQRNALSPSKGTMIYNTDYDQLQTWIGTAWSGITGNKDLGIECASAMDCASGFCVDSVCCNTSLDNCNGCRRCNVTGSMGVCIDDGLECTGTCDVCSSGTCIADVTLCIGNCDDCTGSGTNYSCSALASLCTGNCDICTGADTAYNCAASDALCSNNTSSCGCSGSGTAFDCTTCPDTYDVCGHPTCSSYTCGNAYDDGVHCATCKVCSNGDCSVSMTTNWGAGTYGCAAGETTDPNRCYSASCINCGGWGNGGNCWYNVTTDCTTGCSGYGGVYNGTCDWVNGGLNVASHFSPEPEFNSGSFDWGPCYHAIASGYRTYSHAAGSNCLQSPYGSRQCSCNQ